MCTATGTRRHLFCSAPCCQDLIGEAEFTEEGKWVILPVDHNGECPKHPYMPAIFIFQPCLHLMDGQPTTFNV